ncbi:polyamine ABC transporter substrate-binding protein [Chitinivorax sp. B]|uniref:polyamine ABC transporter substrate-binding protein n=1 Tax=Chitinivorax sp. B TaxID=2502235 RepID=UPI0010F97851|nr:polyamine ABC transporter substrate-binding protein [Chitinivorax sp. B]
MHLFRIAGLVGLLVTVNTAHGAGQLNVYNWNDYVGDNTVANFGKEFDVKVKYDLYDANETLQAKLVTGKSGYDIVVPSLEFAAKQIQSGLYLKLDKSKLPNFNHLDPAILGKMQSADPGNEYLVPYMWGTTAYGINTERVKQALGGEALPVDMWELVFNPKYTSKLKSCGISFMDTGSDVYSMLNIYRGRDANDFSKDALEDGNKVLKEIRKDIRVFNSSPINLLADGDTCLALGFNGDVYIARDRAKEAKKKFSIEYIVPDKGTIVWIDAIAIPKDSKNIGNAHQWINYILRPEVAADISNKVNYANPNTKATELVNKSLRDDPKIYMNGEALTKLQPKKPISTEQQRMITTYFNRFKAGK